MADILLSFNKHLPALTFTMAKHAAKRAYDWRGKMGEEMEAVTSIILCAVVVESSINEISDFFEKPPKSVKIDYRPPFDFYSLELRTKWSLLPLLIRHRTFDRSAEPWQSFEVLVELRNFVMHLRRRPLSKRVAGFLETKSGGKLTFEVAEWACNTVAAMFDELTELIGLTDRPLQHYWYWSPSRSFPYGLSTPGDAWPRK